MSGAGGSGDGSAVTVRVAGELTRRAVQDLWRRAESEVRVARGGRVVVEAGGVTALDGAGMALLVRLRLRAEEAGGFLELRGLAESYRRLLDRFDGIGKETLGNGAKAAVLLPEQVGLVTVQVWRDLRVQVAFIGELAQALFGAVRRPLSLRWKDVWLAAERAGADALPIVSLISLLVGLVLAFQAAMAMRPYGAEIYVADLVTIATLRELGPLMTAIILAGRSGGAFAAEIGTMKVNDEVAALSTMGLDPVPFLALPRVLGLVLMVPFLTMFANLMGILGGAVMFLSLEYPLSTYFQQAIAAGDPQHLLSGLVKSLAFGVTVAGVGCLRGLQTLRGPSAVGQSTTRAVVTAILLIVVVDAILGTVFYYVGF